MFPYNQLTVTAAPNRANGSLEIACHSSSVNKLTNFLFWDLMCSPTLYRQQNIPDTSIK